MALIKCPNCNQEVSSKALECPHCNYKIQNQNENKIEQEKVINFFINYAIVVRILSLIAAFIVFINTIISLEETDGLSLVTGIIITISLIISGLFMENIFKWVAYMLKNTYEMNDKMK